MKKLVTLFLASVLLIANLATSGGQARAAGTVGAQGSWFRDPDSGVVFCDRAHTRQADFVVNGQPVCTDPAPYRVQVPGGERVMVPLRALSEALGGITLDWYTVRGPGGTYITYVLGANRHRAFQLRTGATTVNRWQIGSDRKDTELTPLRFDAAVEIRDGRTFLPLRAAVEALGGVVTSTSPNIEIAYSDSVTDSDLTWAEKMVSGARSAYRNGLLSGQDVWFLGDYALFRQTELDQGNPQWASLNPGAYVHFVWLHKTAELGREPNDDETRNLAAQAAVFVGRVLSIQDFKELGRWGESAIDVLAEEFGWSEDGTDPYTGEYVNFRPYNDLQRNNDDINGPDRVHTLKDGRGIIISYLIGEGKATVMRPWVGLYRYRDNMPLLRQVDRLADWGNPSVSVPFRTMQQNLRAYQEMLEAGKISVQEFQALIRPFRLAMSPKGGFSQVAQKALAEEGATWAAVNMERELIGGVIPKPPPSER